MKLYGFPASLNTWKVRAVAAHLGCRLDFELVDLIKGQSHTPAFLALNPTGRVPVLVDGDFTLWESTAIMQYIAGLSPNALWPADARRRADIMRWQSWDLEHWGPQACTPLIFERVVKPLANLGAPDPAVLAAGAKGFEREARVLDAHLAKQPYLTGDDVTLADFSVAAHLFLTEAADLPLAPHAHVRDWFARVSALPAWSETAPALVPAPVAAQAR